eukprot:4759414-Prymnesium_polylepis.1
MSALSVGQTNDTANVSYADVPAETMGQYLATASCYNDHGCLPFWKADGTCHEVCNNTACNFDDGDCAIPGADVVAKAPEPQPGFGMGTGDTTAGFPFGRRLSESADDASGGSNATTSLSLVWRPPRYFYPSASKFNLSVDTAGEQDGVIYFVQYDARQMLPSDSAVLNDDTLTARLVPELFMDTAYGWWVQARSTCAVPDFDVVLAESTYMVRVCDFAAPAGMNPA